MLKKNCQECKEPVICTICQRKLCGIDPQDHYCCKIEGYYNDPEGHKCQKCGKSQGAAKPAVDRYK
jgi:hypothetical protein